MYKYHKNYYLILIIHVINLYNFYIYYYFSYDLKILLNDFPYFFINFTINLHSNQVNAIKFKIFLNFINY